MKASKFIIKSRITCPVCGKEMYSLGYARHRKMHRDVDKKIIQRIKDFRDSQQDIPPDIARYINKHFWDLI